MVGDYIVMKKRIVHLLSSSSFSGAEKIAINIIEELSMHYEFIYVSPEGPIRKVLEEKNISYIPLDKINPYSLYVLFKKIKPYAVHAHDFRASIKLALSMYNCKKISHIHQNPDWIGKINFNTLLYGISTMAYDNIILVSENLNKQFIFSKLIKKKTKVLLNSVDVEKVKKLSKEYEYPEVYDVAFLGRLAEVKNPIHFIEIINGIKSHKPDIKAVMIGEGELLNVCNQKISELNIEENIKLVGFNKNPFPIVNNCKIIIIPSKWEGFGLVSVEAMSLGKPVLASPVGGLNEIVDDKCGKICSSQDEFINEAIDLLQKRNKYRIKSDNAIKRSERFNNVKEWVEALYLIYNS